MNYLRGKAIEVSETKTLHFDKLSDHATRAKKQDFFYLGSWFLVLGSWFFVRMLDCTDATPEAEPRGILLIKKLHLLHLEVDFIPSTNLK